MNAHDTDSARRDAAERQVRPTIVCLCGSTRFSQAFQDANLRETLEGRIVLTIGCDMRADGDLFAGLHEAEIEDIKARLDVLHLRKIDLADEVLILNVGGYIGQSTQRELEYAIANQKRIRFLETPSEDADSLALLTPGVSAAMYSDEAAFERMKAEAIKETLNDD